jgi:8-hydroxy-5-deazaflavin:NADPH oxidoreductase
MNASDTPVVGIVGGTGPQGRGLALRLGAAGVPVWLGSRDVARAEEAAATLAAELGDRAGSRAPTGVDNAAAASAPTVFLSVPYSAHAAVLRELAPVLAGRLVVDVVVPLQPPPNLGVVVPAAGGSAAEEAQALLPQSRVVGAFHNVSARLLLRLGADPECDVLVTGDDEAAKAAVIALTELIGLRGLDAGPLANSRVVEGLTAVLLGLNKRYATRHAGIRITRIGDGGRP